MLTLWLLVALAAPAQWRTVTWPDGSFSLEIPAEWDWSEQEIEPGGDVAWMALAPHWEDAVAVVRSKKEPLEWIAAHYAAVGTTISNPVTERRKDGWHRITYTTKDQRGTRYAFVYASRGIMLATESESNVEPDALKRAVASLRWLKP
jgi:hypothetical protein